MIFKRDKQVTYEGLERRAVPSLSERVFTIDMIIQYVGIIAFLVAGWITLTGTVEANETGIAEVKKELGQQASDIQSIKTDVAVILEHQTEADKQAERRAIRQDKQTQRILEQLQENARHIGHVNGAAGH